MDRNSCQECGYIGNEEICVMCPGIMRQVSIEHVEYCIPDCKTYWNCDQCDNSYVCGSEPFVLRSDRNDRSKICDSCSALNATDRIHRKKDGDDLSSDVLELLTGRQVFKIKPAEKQLDIEMKIYGGKRLLTLKSFIIYDDHVLKFYGRYEQFVIFVRHGKAYIKNKDSLISINKTMELISGKDFKMLNHLECASEEFDI